jgi:hypothetical protein
MSKIMEMAANVYQNALDRHEARIVNNILSMESFVPIRNGNLKKLKKIAFVVPTLKKFAGGHTVHAALIWQI